MNTSIPLCVPSAGAAEEQAVLSALRSGWISPAGPQLMEFEAQVAKLTDRPAAVAVSSGTAALHLALLTAGIGAGDAVAVATLTFAATANALAYVGARPVFIDCDQNGTMSVDLLEAALSERAGTNRPIRAVVPVDLYGRPADHPRIGRLAARYDAIVVSDAAESLGATLAGRPAGGYGDFAAVSFNGNKIVTTSSGGAVLCPDQASAQRVRHLSTQARQPVLHYEHLEVGYNYRLSNLLAALGLAQLARLPEILRIKRSHHRAYQQLAEMIDGLDVLGAADGNCWMTVLLVDQRFGLTAELLGGRLREAGIETRPVFKPMHLQPVHRGADVTYINGTAERLYRNGLALPSSTDLTTTDRDRVIGAIAEFAENRSPVT